MTSVFELVSVNYTFYKLTTLIVVFHDSQTLALERAKVETTFIEVPQSSCDQRLLKGEYAVSTM